MKEEEIRLWINQFDFDNDCALKYAEFTRVLTPCAEFEVTRPIQSFSN